MYIVSGLRMTVTWLGKPIVVKVVQESYLNSNETDFDFIDRKDCCE